MTAETLPARSFQVTLYVKPIGKARARVTKEGRAYTPEKTASAEAEIRWLVQMKHPPKLEGPLALRATFYVARPKSAPKRKVYPCVRPDLDNYIKTLTDALNGLCYVDDAQIVRMDVAKEYGEERIELCLEEIR